MKNPPLKTVGTPARFAAWSAICAYAVFTIAATVLLGWAVDVPVLESVGPGMISMKVNTAVGLILLAIVLVTLRRSSSVSKWIGTIALCIVALLSLATLYEYAFHVDLKIDDVVFHDYKSPRFPGRNAPATNIAFLGLATAFALLQIKNSVRLGQILLMVVTTAPLATLGGYLYGAPAMYQNVPYPVIALNTSIALVLLCVGGLFARSHDGLMGVITSRSLAGSVARKLLPAAIGVPLLIGLGILLGQREGLYTAAFGSAALVASCAVLFAGAVAWTTTLLWNTEQLHSQAEAEREQLLTAEQSARTQAERANRMKDEFLSVISHELRTPLTAILGWAQILQYSSKTEDPAEGLNIIVENALAQRQIIEDLLDMSRIISGKLRLKIEPMRLQDVIAATCQSLQPAADAKSVTITRELDATAPAISGDAGRLQQVVWNLLSNAIKFTPRTGHIRIALDEWDDHLRLTVSDSGEGISADFLPFMFDRFRQADASTKRMHGGLGLGLSIVKQIVELHGGTVSAASGGVGHGSIFTALFPLTTERKLESGQSPMALRSEESSATAPKSEVSLAGLRVIAVDDEPHGRSMVKRLLEKHHAVVSTAGSADDAIELLEHNQFDVLISDIGMPGNDGYNLIKRVRSGRASAIFAISLTAFARAEDRAKSLDAGYNAYLSKPVKADELVNALFGSR